VENGSRSKPLAGERPEVFIPAIRIGALDAESTIEDRVLVFLLIDELNRIDSARLVHPARWGEQKGQLKPYIE
jgi:hypothetical protein